MTLHYPLSYTPHMCYWRDTFSLHEHSSAIILGLADTNYAQLQSRDEQTAYSPPVYPSPWMKEGVDGWADAYAKAKEFVSKLTLMEKVNLTTGIGYVHI